MKTLMEFISLYLLFNILNWLDFYLTKKILKIDGKELNPIIRTVGLLPVKIGAVVLFGLAGYFINWTILIPVNVIMAGACVWNYYQLEKIND